MTDLIPIRRDQHLRILGMLSSYVTTLAGIDYPDNDEGDYHQRINENKRAAVNSTIAELRAILAAPRQPEGDAASILLPALRQYMHNDGSGLLAGYEYERTQQIVAKLQKEYEWVVSINEALNESNIRAWADLTFLAEYVVGREYGTTLPNYEALGRYPPNVAEAVIAVTPSTPLTISTADIQSPLNKD